MPKIDQIECAKCVKFGKLAKPDRPESPQNSGFLQIDQTECANSCKLSHFGQHVILRTISYKLVAHSKPMGGE
jgi:hypothetical protein